jgi:hypothetical protein
MNYTQLNSPPKLTPTCWKSPNYIVCETYQTLVLLMDGYYPIVETLVTRLTEWPNFVVAVGGAVVLLTVSGDMVCRILKIIFG